MRANEEAMTDYATVLSRGMDHLLAQQHADGRWYGPMYSNCAMEADDLLLREFLGIRTPEITEATARWLRYQQGSDGAWVHSPGGPGNLSTTIEAYLALRIAGDEPNEPHMVRAAEYCRRSGGIRSSRTGTRFWLALFGQWPWSEVPVMLPEQLFVPARSPFSIYAFAGWSRIALVPLAIVCAHRPVCPLSFKVDELLGGSADIASSRRAPGAAAFALVDKWLHRYERHPLRRLRGRALRASEQWLLKHQEADGTWLGVHPVSLFGVLALHAAGFAADDPVMKAALAGLDGFAVEASTPAGPARRIAACPGPVWDTALAVLALTDGGLPGDHEALQRAAGWLLEKEVRVPGDWAIRRPALTAGAWSFAPELNNYPDCDDSAAVILALQRVKFAPGSSARAQVEEASQRGVAWLLGMQSRAGGWATYDPGDVSRVTRAIANQPFNDYGPVIDPAWGGDLTGHVVETLGRQGLGADPRVIRGVRWLLDIQEKDGSWYGRWGTNYVYGTGAVVPALVAAGVVADSPAVVRAIQWLTEHQDPDGGWGEDCRSYDDSKWRGRGESTPSQTAWALLAFHAAGVAADDPRVRRGLDWLAEHQAADGGWEETVFTGVGHPGELFFGYPMYAEVFPLMAIGRYLAPPSGS
jgi:squalene-hopene/tetraprenyl-beta-curcumene cyclase